MSKLTILMYHKVAEPPANARHLGNYVTPAQFSEELAALTEWGYRTIGFEDWIAHRSGRGSLPPRPLIITFDDGYRSFLDHAWPALRARGMRATMFLVAGQIGGTNAWDGDEIQEPLLDATDIRALHESGLAFGSHTYSHIALGRVAPERALDDLRRSRETLEALLGGAVSVLSYPYSNQNRRVRAFAAQAGFRAAVRGKGRMNWRYTDLFGLRRIKPDLRMTISDLRKVLFRERWLRI